MRVRILFGLAAVLLTQVELHAQISWSGIFDFGASKGGAGSKLELNQVSNSYLQLNVQDFQLFINADVDKEISLSAKVSTNRQSPLDPRSINLELAYATFWGLAGNSLNISAGKILTPFGAFTRRQLSPDNPLIGNPLFFYYQTNISPVLGYLDPSGVLLAQTAYGGRLSTVYNGGYFVGIQAFGNFLDDLIEYNIALMNSPLCDPNTSVNLDKEPALHGRIAVHPAIWGTLGFSYCTGSFIDHNIANDFYSGPSWGGTEQFKQTTAGLDLTFSYLFYEINAEFMANTFRAPYIVYNYYYTPPYWTGLTSGTSLNLSSNELLVDVKIDAPFYPGLFLAGRYNTVSFGSIVDPWPTSATFGTSIPWDRNVSKYAIGVGYKPARGVLIKIGYERTVVDVKPAPDLDVIASQLSVSF